MRICCTRGQIAHAQEVWDKTTTDPYFSKSVAALSFIASTVFLGFQAPDVCVFQDRCASSEAPQDNNRYTSCEDLGCSLKKLTCATSFILGGSLFIAFIVHTIMQSIFKKRERVASSLEQPLLASQENS